MADVDENQLNPAAENVEKLSGDKPARYRDYRELLEKQKPDIAIVATPDHWHPLVMIAAVRAGAHVYVEKPISHTVLEGKAMVKAAREADRVVAVGLHRRVSPHKDRKSTRLKLQSRLHLVCRLLLEKKKNM